ncbi:hypothetical protein QBC33DRAFT_532485 [Phialemonium atrogriseum]|uniref:L-ascorbic acid binding protein n=1 Tax=Phialemonium atrogriseum TaxID=1093897 RepID=A0AAJ0FQH7_9PEZI|nr:uncharacterized protein QBC33DRAFT_532485 [Phialemonium atrogriseum]KAK1769170.1 hypothetical protein QBC33DRAFT_532485 [Phialemonium atrogriseum]
MAIPATSTRLLRFIEATSLVYGPLTNLTASTASTWSPPTTPGAGGHKGRYLWTDAFGLVNLVTLHRETGSPTYLVLARRLAAAVHHTLGRTRDGSAPLPGAEPGGAGGLLRGGLRIGKRDAEGPDGDGQYHHYLTLWMFALDRLAVAVGGDEGAEYSRLAVQLAEAVHPRFVVGGGGREQGKQQQPPSRMVWKVSADMREVLVPSEGHLDAATGFVVYRLLQRTAVERFGQAGEPPLRREIEDYRALMGREGRLAASKDPLDLGMGLWMCHFFRGEDWAARLGADSLARAAAVLGPGGVATREASRRLAFREFGTCLGVQCYGAGEDVELAASVEGVIDFWERYLEVSTDEDLRPISLVMYAAALIPGAFKDGYLDEKK